jgi:hypothetical protein
MGIPNQCLMFNSTVLRATSRPGAKPSSAAAAASHRKIGLEVDLSAFPFAFHLPAVKPAPVAIFGYRPGLGSLAEFKFFSGRFWIVSNFIQIADVNGPTLPELRRGRTRGTS